MILTFMGTRGDIEMRTQRHRMHTSLLVSHRAAIQAAGCSRRPQGDAFNER